MEIYNDSETPSSESNRCKIMEITLEHRTNGINGNYSGEET